MGEASFLTLFNRVPQPELQKAVLASTPGQNMSYLYMHLINVHCGIVFATYHEDTSAPDSEPLEAPGLAGRPAPQSQEQKGA